MMRSREGERLRNEGETRGMRPVKERKRLNEEPSHGEERWCSATGRVQSSSTGNEHRERAPGTSTGKLRRGGLHEGVDRVAFKDRRYTCHDARSSPIDSPRTQSVTSSSAHIRFYRFIGSIAAWLLQHTDP
ncbi:hypothetical protein EYF80_063233 [Liparis tanakae]|uniref:Uncharacterized protein n=1 Tax=Liparis tanakae TaxID=230148 RepID=A0A4Z2EDJ5_9TELE|nr:hypothetical protein EYF80_063233 [Liparis tanakae]